MDHSHETRDAANKESEANNPEPGERGTAEEKEPVKEERETEPQSSEQKHKSSDKGSEQNNSARQANNNRREHGEESEERTGSKERRSIKEEKKESKEDKKDKQIKELTDLLQRLQADFDNYRRRTLQEAEQQKKLSNEELIKRILPVLDNFELALKHKTIDKAFAEGVQMVFAQLMTVLEDEGLKPIQATGKKFDPHLHEAVLQEESEEEDRTILAELQRGYTLNGKVIRHAKVKIARKKERR